MDLGGHGMGCGLVFRSPNPGTELLKCNHMFNLNNLRSMMCQFEYKNETIPIIIESYMIIRSWLYKLLQQL